VELNLFSRTEVRGLPQCGDGFAASANDLRLASIAGQPVGISGEFQAMRELLFVAGDALDGIC
jgi:hypothetical protein